MKTVMKASKRFKRPTNPRRPRFASLLLKRPDDLHDGNLPAYSKEGVDVKLIRWMLSLTPAQRLDVLQQNINFIEENSEAARRHRKKKLRQKVRAIRKRSSPANKKP